MLGGLSLGKLVDVMVIEDNSELVKSLDFKICDNVVSLEDQIYIKDLFYGNNFPWYYNPDVSEFNGYQQRPAMFHNFIDENNKVNSTHFDIVTKLIKYAEQVTKKEFKFVQRASTFLQFPLSCEKIGDNLIDQYHVDRVYPHWVILYYVNDYDGETVFSDSIYDGNDLGIVDHTNFNVVKKVQGKQGRFFFFDGRIYHSATQPRKNMKCIINLNVI